MELYIQLILRKQIRLEFRILFLGKYLNAFIYPNIKELGGASSSYTGNIGFRES